MAMSSQQEEKGSAEAAVVVIIVEQLGVCRQKQVDFISRFQLQDDRVGEILRDGFRVPVPVMQNLFVILQHCYTNSSRLIHKRSVL